MGAKKIEEVADIIIINDFDIHTVSEPSRDLLRVISSIDDRAEQESIVRYIPSHKPVAELMQHMNLRKDIK